MSRRAKKPAPAPAIDFKLAARGQGLFNYMDALFTKERIEGKPPTYMMHRFLVSDRVYAPVARLLQRDVREPELVFGVWVALLPKDRGAPRLPYAAPKKPPAEEELVTRMCAVLHESRVNVEAMLSLLEAAGKLADTYREFGVEMDDNATDDDDA